MTGRALITGAGGFVGRHLRTHLDACGWETAGADLRGAEISCDISASDQVDAMLEAVGDVTHVFHLAAIAFVPTASADPSRTMAVNLEGTICLARLMEERCPKARLLFVSTSEVYGPPVSLPVTEAHALDPRNPYAISKAAADQYLGYLGNATKLDIVRARPFNHAGPGQSDDFVLSSFARQVAEMEAGLRETKLQVGNLSAARDFLHVRDVVRAYEMMARQGERGAVYNICSGASVQISEAVEKLQGLARVDVAVEPDPARLRPVDVPEVRGSYDKLHRLTGWRPEHTMDSLLSELLDYWRGEVTRDD